MEVFGRTVWLYLEDDGGVSLGGRHTPAIQRSTRLSYEVGDKTQTISVDNDTVEEM